MWSSIWERLTSASKLAKAEVSVKERKASVKEKKKYSVNERQENKNFPPKSFSQRLQKSLTLFHLVRKAKEKGLKK